MNIYITNKKTNSNYEISQIEYKKISIVNQYKYLGVTINNKLSLCSPKKF